MVCDIIQLFSANSTIGANFRPFKHDCIFSSEYTVHTIYSRNNMGQKCEGNCGLWVLNEILKKTYPESLKKIMGAVWELPDK